MNAAQKKDYISHLEAIGQKGSPEYERAKKKKPSDEPEPKTK